MKRNKIAYIVGGAGLLGLAGAVVYVIGHKPDVVENPCWRSCHLANGACKKSFNKPWKANFQSLMQLLRYGEVCNSYQVGDKYYTGHSKNAWCRNINPFKS